MTATVRDRTADAVGAVLGISPDLVYAAASLFDLPGFDSLAVVAVLDRLESELGVEVPPDLILPEAFQSLDTLEELMRQAMSLSPAEGAR